MKSIIILFIFKIIIICDSVAQNPLGVYLDIDGKVKFWVGEANRNGNIDDSVYMSNKGEKMLIDLRNLKYDYLTLLEAQRDIVTSSCEMDPSRNYDTTEQFESDSQMYSTKYLIDINQSILFLEPYATIDICIGGSEQKEFMDDMRGAGLNDSTVKEIKTILIQYINRLTGKWEGDNERDGLRRKLSLPDTIIEQKVVYDYLVDLFVVHNYDRKNRLTKVIGYHWDLGVEVDSLRYDKKGNLISFCRDKIGSGRCEFIFKYNKHAQVSNICYNYSTVGANRYSTQYTNPEIQIMKFTYNNDGIMNSKSLLQKDGSISTTYYDIRFKKKRSIKSI